MTGLSLQLEFPNGFRECSWSKVHPTGCKTLRPLPAGFVGSADLTKIHRVSTATLVAQTIESVFDE